MERLCAAMRSGRTSAVVEAGMDDGEWRRLMSSGTGGRVRARLHAYLVFPAKSIARLITDPPTVCVPTTNPFFLPWLCVLTKPLHGRPVVPLVYDLYPDVLEAGGRATNNGLVTRLIRATNRSLFRRADGIVFIGGQMAAHARSQYGEPRRWTVIETGAASTEFAKAEYSEPPTELERFARGRILLSYVGNMGQTHDWETLAAVLPTLVRDHGDRIAVVIAASGPGAEKLRQATQDVSSDVLRFVPPLPDHEWTRLLCATQISLVTLRPEARLTCIPSKTFSAMAAGSAIVAVTPYDSDLASCIRARDCGEVVEPGDAAGLLKVLTELIEEPSRLAETRTRARHAVPAHYDMPKLAERWLEFVGAVDRRPSPWHRLAKRALDASSAAAGLVVAAPLMLATALAVRTSVGSPVLFKQPRAGLNGKRFDMLKFRSMRSPLPHEQGPQFDAVRLTRVGRFIRKTSLDELPSLFNVLRGDMSLVGPRPLLLSYVNRYSPRQLRRLDAVPGVTGWAQTRGRNATDWNTRFEQDVWYVDHQSLWLDLKILLATVGAVLGQKDIQHGAHATMPEFQGLDEPAALSEGL
jgi:sugar transferase EpsL